MSASIITPPMPDAPYRGIEAFRFTDQQIFAARSEETWKMLSNVTLYRAVLLYGDSGTGKSSLINAALLPRALKENYVPDRLRVQPLAGREIKVERMRMSGSNEQAAFLPSNFAPAESAKDTEGFELSLDNFKKQLEAFRRTPDEAKSGPPFQTARSRPRPLLIFDQFEEFVTLFEEARPGDNGTEGGWQQVKSRQREILKTLVELIQDETLPIKIVFVFREDYLAKLSLLFDYCPDLLNQAQRLLLPSIAAVPQIIRAPFHNPELRAHFLKRGGNAGSEISESLADKVAAALGHRSEGDKANLTELQIVCQRLWEAPDAEQLFSKDGIEGLLKDYGTDVFRNFTPRLTDVAVVLLSHMITSSNTRNIVSANDLKSRTVECDFQESEYTDVLKTLSDSQIVRREPRHNIYFYEITSEYLVPWIQERVAERKAIEDRHQAEEERFEALVLESKQRRARLLKRAVAGLILLLVITLGMLVTAYKKNNLAKMQAQRATSEANKAIEEKQRAESITEAFKLLNGDTEEKVLQGIAQVDQLIQEQKVSPDVKSVIITAASTNQDKRVQDAANKVLKQVVRIEATPPIENPTPRPSSTAPNAASPTPQPGPPKGVLALDLVDAEGETLLSRARPRLTLRNLSQSKDEFERTGTELDLEEGAYDVFVNVGGYIQTYRQFRIKGNSRTVLTLKLTRRKSVPQQTTPRPEQVIIPVEQHRRRGNPQSTPQ